MGQSSMQEWLGWENKSTQSWITKASRPDTRILQYNCWKPKVIKLENIKSSQEAKKRDIFLSKQQTTWSAVPVKQKPWNKGWCSSKCREYMVACVDKTEHRKEHSSKATFSGKIICCQHIWTKENTKTCPSDLKENYPGSEIWQGIKYYKKGICRILNEYDICKYI